MVWNSMEKTKFQKWRTPFPLFWVEIIRLKIVGGDRIELNMIGGDKVELKMIGGDEVELKMIGGDEVELKWLEKMKSSWNLSEETVLVQKGTYLNFQDKKSIQNVRTEGEIRKKSGGISITTLSSSKSKHVNCNIDTITLKSKQKASISIETLTRSIQKENLSTKTLMQLITSITINEPKSLICINLSHLCFNWMCKTTINDCSIVKLNFFGVLLQLMKWTSVFRLFDTECCVIC